MVNVRLKQAIALFIAIAFVSSIFFFFPHVSSTSPVTYYILVPSAALRANASSFGTLSVERGVSDDIIAFSGSVPVSNLIASNISNMLSFTESMLKQENISYNLSAGNIQCAFSKEFVEPLCADPYNNTAWTVFSVGPHGSLNPVQKSLSSINLNSINYNSTFILAFFGFQNSSNSNSSTGVPPINIG